MTLRITIIDDHTLFRAGLKSLLDLHGLEVLDSVGDGETGLEAVQQRRPDVVLLDLRLPEVDGLQVLRKLKRIKDGPPVVLLTTSAREKDLADALRAGASGYLLKDMDPDELVAALRSIVLGKTIVAQSLTPLLAGLVQRKDMEVPPEGGLFDALTPREREILVLLAEGLSNRSIAERLVISEGTVKAHVKAILRKLKVGSRVAAAVLAVEHGLGGSRSISD